MWLHVCIDAWPAGLLIHLTQIVPLGIFTVYMCRRTYCMCLCMSAISQEHQSDPCIAEREREFDGRLFVASSPFSLNHWDEMAHLLVCHIEILPDPEPSFGLAETGPVRPIKVFYQGKTEIRVKMW